MGMFVSLAICSIYAIAAWFLVRTCGVTWGLLAFALATIVTTGFGGWLLCRSSVDKVTWRNRLAGLCLPWTHWVGGGTLAMLLFKNLIAGIVISMLIAVCEKMQWFHGQSPESTTATGSALGLGDWIVYSLTLVCWVVAGGLWAWMLRSLLKNRSDFISVLTRERGIWYPLLIPPLAIVISIGLRLSGFPWWALIVIAAPLLYGLLPVLVILGVILVHAIQGKPIRWN